MKPKKITCYESYLVVSGFAISMVDMLRYDNCMPATEVMSNIFRRALVSNEPDIFVFRRRALTSGGATIGRWESFTAKVLGEFDNFQDAIDRAEALHNEKEP